MSLEQEIVVRIRRRDSKGIELLYDHYANFIYGLIHKIVKVDDVADLVLQDTFLKVWEKIDAYDQYKGRFLTWVLNVAKNTAIDMLRSKQYREGSKLTSLDQLPGRPAKTEIRVDDIGIKEVVNRLDRKYQIIIDLIYFNGFTYAETAKELGIPLGTVKSRVRKAFSELRILLNDE
ncbi:MAG: RNA polymerase sigma factor [Bacteroidota bacterium]